MENKNARFYAAPRSVAATLSSLLVQAISDGESESESGRLQAVWESGKAVLCLVF